MTQVDGGGVPAGTQLNGIYEIEKRIAMGGMGEVYIGKVIQTGDKVAIKMILPEHANNDIILDLFRKEASTLHNLYHEAIVRYYLFSVDPVLNRPYMVMEFAGGPDLTDRLREGGPLGQAEMDVLRPRVAGGLHAAHKLGVIHRDISPDNVILVDGQVEKAKIIDFGIAKSTTSEGTLIGSGFAGKLNYVSPEQLGLEGGEVTGKSDIYSLGLVFAEAVIGRPLPMGGSQVEVIDKRRVLPDLSEIPEFIRPLIEAMIQPDPANRPSDMDEVANWTQGGADPGVAPVAGGAAPVRHPRDRRRGRDEEEKKGGLPWMWLGLGGLGAAAAGAAAFVMLGEPDTPPNTGKVGLKTPSSDLNPGLSPTQPGTGNAGTLAGPAGPVTASPGEIGQSYGWVSQRFAYGGAAADLTMSVEGGLPTGLAFQNMGDGTGRIYGVPEQAGDFSFVIVATSPEGDSARQDVRLGVAVQQIAAITPTEPAAPTLSEPTAPTISTPTLSQPSGGGDSGVPRVDGGGGGTLLAPAQPSAPTLTPGTPSTGSAPTLSPAPSSGTATAPSTGTPSLTAPSGGDSGVSGVGGSGGAGTPIPRDKPARLSAGGNDPSGTALSASPVDNQPGDDLAEPTVATGLPGGLTPPTPSGGSGSVSAGGSDGSSLAIPRTGAAQAQPSTGDTTIAAIPKPENQPPTIQDQIGAPVGALQGQEINERLGSFFDEDGPGAFELRVEGRLPNGVSVIKAPGGVVQLYGQAEDFGQFEVRIAAVDPQGLVSRAIPVRIEIARDSGANPAVRDYILGYNGGACFLSRPMELGARTAQIEVFAAEIPPVVTFDADFKRDQGFEANIGLRLITQDQCALVNALDQVGPQAMDNSLRVVLVKDELASGDTLRGRIVGGDGAKLFLFDHLGGMNDLSSFVKTSGGETSFAVPINASGPQILIAARPRDVANADPNAGLELLLGAAQRGEASLALGFFMIK